jgi:MmyB-like transcription regulator ligand binding domain
VRGHSRGRKRVQHPEAGELTLGYQVMHLLGTPGQHLITYCAEPGTPDHDAIVLLDMLGAQQPSPAAQPADDTPGTA